MSIASPAISSQECAQRQEPQHRVAELPNGHPAQDETGAHRRGDHQVARQAAALEFPVVQEADCPDEDPETQRCRAYRQRRRQSAQRDRHGQPDRLPDRDRPGRDGTRRSVDAVHFQVEDVVQDQRRSGQQEDAGKAQDRLPHGGQPAQRDHLAHQDGHPGGERQFRAEEAY